MLLQGSNPKVNFFEDVPRNPTRAYCMQIKQEIKRKKNPLEEREERVGSQGGEKKHGQVARLEPSLGQEDGKG